MELQKTTIPIMFQETIRARDFEWEPTETYCAFDALFIGITEFLAESKSKEKKVALKLSDLKGNFKMAGIVQYHENENADMPGNWSYVLTFDEEDIKDAVVSDSNDASFYHFFAGTLHRKHGFKIDVYQNIQLVIMTVIDTLLDYLDKNADPSQVIEVELEACFKAAAAVEKGEKVFSITPDGALKRLIKSDAALS